MSGIAPPEGDVGIFHPREVFLVHGLSGDSERLSYLGPRPAIAERLLDLGIFDPVREVAEVNNGCESVGGFVQGIAH
jgi:hypothetical protein